jgi:hypothetical protein
MREVMLGTTLKYNTIRECLYYCHLPAQFNDFQQHLLPPFRICGDFYALQYNPLYKCNLTIYIHKLHEFSRHCPR